uniref:MFS-type transporter SLC18B1-like n=1 Tax=Dermatophagoides pteronyssinus TaxID=6956 RepID=A0A6P6YKQ3_DERPT|nr:MFS-type transporter SLC18B1-like [Dermatophagoides pteronyssinus]
MAIITESADFIDAAAADENQSFVSQNNNQNDDHVVIVNSHRPIVISSQSESINNHNHRNSNIKHTSVIQQPLTSMQTKFIIVLLAVCNFFIANGVSLQGPFFPKEAEQKGVTPLIYSSIFAIYELIMLITSFLFGNFAEKFKPNRMSGLGLILTGLATTAFGFITYLNVRIEFVLIAFTLRIIESLGATAFATSSYSFISVCFPDRTATMFATMEMFFGLGVITGPVIGGFLYNFDGFLLPFLTNGIVIIIFGIILISKPVEKLFYHGKLIGQMQTHNTGNDNDGGNYLDANDDQESNTLILPINESSSSSSETSNVRNDSSITTIENPEVTLGSFLSSTIVLIDSFIIITAITLMGFNGATLEPFIRHEGISNQTLHTSLMFVALGASYSFSALFWGKICDKFPSFLICFALAGSFVTGIGLLFLGPVPFLQSTIRPTLLTISLCMILFGIGTSSKQVAAYTHALNHTIIARKFPKNQKTYGLISGMFFSCLSFGGFIGPIIGGSLLQWSDFHLATFVMFSIECFVFLILLILQCFYRRSTTTTINQSTTATDLR